jgi:hypothetical protein
VLERSNFPEMSGPRNSDVRFIDIDRILSILRRQYLVLSLGLALGISLGILYLLLAPRTYVSASQILIDKNLQEIAGEVAQPTSALDLEAEILNQIEVLKSSQPEPGACPFEEYEAPRSSLRADFDQLPDGLSRDVAGVEIVGSQQQLGPAVVDRFHGAPGRIDAPDGGAGAVDHPEPAVVAQAHDPITSLEREPVDLDRSAGELGRHE